MSTEDYGGLGRDSISRGARTTSFGVTSTIRLVAWDFGSSSLIIRTGANSTNINLESPQTLRDLAAAALSVALYLEDQAGDPPS